MIFIQGLVEDTADWSVFKINSTDHFYMYML